jgi:FtsH-binding integral membrane protein
MASTTNTGHSRYSREGKEGPDLGIYVESIADDTREWFEVQKETTKLELSEHLAKLTAKVVSVLVVGLLVATVLVMWFIALALWIGELLGHTPLGFVVAGGIFVVLGAVFLILWKNGMKDKVMLSVINAIHDAD